MSDKPEYPETIKYVDSDSVWCMGEDMDHPKVYYAVPEEGYVKCNYCDKNANYNYNTNLYY